MSTETESLPATPGRVTLAVVHFLAALAGVVALMFIVIDLPSLQAASGDVAVAILSLAAIGLSITVFAAVGSALLRLNPSSWRFARVGQIVIAGVAALLTLVTATITIWAIAEGGLGGGIALFVSPVTVFLPVAFSALNWWGFAYLNRPYVREAFHLVR